jgi:hypothetical protein
LGINDALILTCDPRLAMATPATAQTGHRQIIAAFCGKTLKLPSKRPNHGDETPKLVG